jgi:hypothetical protein
MINDSRLLFSLFLSCPDDIFVLRVQLKEGKELHAGTYHLGIFNAGGNMMVKMMPLL